MKRISAAGIEMDVVDRGRGEVVVLLHGFPLEKRMWSEQIDVLSAQYRVIAPDLRGFGASDVGVQPSRLHGAGGTPAAPCVTMEQFADDTAALLDALQVAEPVTLCGLSMGGYVAFEFWRKYRARLAGLILCDTWAAPDAPEVAAARLENAARVLDEGPAPLVEAMLPKLLARGTPDRRPQVAAALERMMLDANPRGVAAALRGMAARRDFTPLLGEIALPVLVIVGAQDAVSTPAEMLAICRAIPTGRYVEIPAAGHMSPMEDPGEVNGAILEFLATR